MSWVDLPLFVLILIAAGFGLRGGFVARWLSWLGVALGLYLGIWLTPTILDLLPASNPPARVVVAMAFLIFMAIVGESCGTLLTRWLRSRRRAEPDFDPRKAAGDRVAGAIAGIITMTTIIWMLIPAAGSAPGWTARTNRDSLIVGVVQELYPLQTQQMVEWGQAVSDVPFPAATEPTDGGPSVAEPPRKGLPDDVLDETAGSVVRVAGEACGQIESGTGFVLEPGFVITNAHVVAGQERTTVFDAEGTEYPATVVAFDPDLDIAVVEAPDLDASTIPLVLAQPGQLGAFLGYPGGGDFTEAPAVLGEEFSAVGTDIHHESQTVRDVMVAGARLEPGFSGAPFVADDGGVMAMAFAIDPGNPKRVYALKTEDIRDVFNRRKSKPVNTGQCIWD